MPPTIPITSHPRLNEGLAVYLSEGYGPGERACVANAAAQGADVADRHRRPVPHDL
ncbi:MAG: hypothetical protein R3C32_10670 [Chloroflexota bacterium]